MNFRPQNETPADLQREDDARQTLAFEFGHDITKLSPFLYQCDWCFHDGLQVLGFAEFKYRHKKYDFMMLALAKWLHLRDLMNETLLPVWIVFQFDDGIYWRKYEWIHAETPKIQFGGSNRGQPGDKEPIVLLPIKEFTKIKAMRMTSLVS